MLNKKTKRKIHLLIHAGKGRADKKDDKASPKKTMKQLVAEKAARKPLYLSLKNKTKVVTRPTALSFDGGKLGGFVLFYGSFESLDIFVTL